MTVKANLEDALASIDWAERQVLILSADIAALAEAKPYKITAQFSPAPSGRSTIGRFYIQKTGPTSNLLAGTIASIIQAQRQSLDYLAVALAEANGAVDPTDTYFPIVKDQAALADKGTLKKIRRLRPDDQKIILDLKPYRGGNDTLYALHWLNIERKHRRLGLMAGAQRGVQFIANNDGPTQIARISGPNAVALTSAPALILTMEFSGAPPDLRFGIDLTFADVDGRPNVDVGDLLAKFNAECREVMGRFA